MSASQSAVAAFRKQGQSRELPFDPKAFRMALGSFATGVTVITTLDAAGKDVGVTASSFNTVSLNPPLVLWSLDRRAFCLKAFEQSSHFVVNVLAANQVDISNRFARSGADKFSGLDLRRGLRDIAVLPDTSACFQCAVEHRYDGGDHIILVGRVLDFKTSDVAGLIFQQGRYAIGTDHPMTRRGFAQTEDEGGFVRGFLPYVTGRCHQALMDGFKLALQGSPLSAAQYRVLFSLREADQCDKEKLCELSLLGENRVDMALDELFVKSLVSLDGDYAAVTRRGLEVLAEAEARLVAWEKQTLLNMPDGEAAALKEKLGRLSDRCIQWLADETIVA